MRKFVIAAAMAGTAITLSACSGDANDVDDRAVQEPTMSIDESSLPTAGTNTVMDANSVTTNQLTAVEGMTPEAAEAFVAGQPYADNAALKAKLMESMDEEQVNAAMEKVFVPINLNSASQEEIMMIPGMTDRMVGEFLEYRPYENIEEFNREIGKYVDEAEVARLRSYVTL